MDVWDSIIDLFSNLEKLEKQLRIAQQEEVAALDPKLEELNAVEAMMVQTEADAVEIGQALKRATGLVAKSLEQNMTEVNQRYDALCKRQGTLQTELSVTQLTDDAIQGVIEFAQDVFVGKENADFHVKRRNLEILNVQVVVDNGRFTIYSSAGEISGEIRKLPKATRWGGSGGGSTTNDGGVTSLRSQGPSLPVCRFHARPLRLAA